jgi:hypothetical protein
MKKNTVAKSEGVKTEWSDKKKLAEFSEGDCG